MTSLVYKDTITASRFHQASEVVQRAPINRSTIGQLDGCLIAVHLASNESSNLFSGLAIAVQALKGFLRHPIVIRAHEDLESGLQPILKGGQLTGVPLFVPPVVYTQAGNVLGLAPGISWQEEIHVFDGVLVIPNLAVMEPGTEYQFGERVRVPLRVGQPLHVVATQHVK